MRKIFKNEFGFNVKFIMLILFVMIGSMTIGYSALQQTLYIRGETKIEKPDYKIAITSIEVSSVDESGYQNSTPSYSGTEGSLYSVLPNTSSKVIYKLNISNLGKTSGVLDFTVASLDNANVKYKIKGINNGDILAAGENAEVYVIFEYWDDVSSISNNEVSSLVNFMFTPYSDGYSNSCLNSWDGSSQNEPALVDVYGTSYYAITNANEFAWFANTVNSGTTNINAYLDNDICLNSNSLQISNFTGIFDGQNRTISGFNFSKTEEIDDSHTSYVGLFKTNSGTIKNLNFTANYYDEINYRPGTFTGNDNVYGYFGGLVTTNNGKISNVSMNGDYTAEYIVRTNCAAAKPTLQYYVGGISGVNNGVITGSYNNMSMYIRSTISRTACNYSKHQYVYEGGIVGHNTGYVSDSYNKQKVESSVLVNNKNSNYYGRIGGIVGNLASGKVKDSYNIGKIAHGVEETEEGVAQEKITGCAIGSASGTVSNVYYLDSCGFTGGGTVTSSYDLSNLTIDIGNYFVKDNRSLNNGYPILGWQN